MPLYRIREVNGRDPEIAADLRDLHERTFGDTSYPTTTDRGHWWLAYDGDDPVAFAGLVRSYKYADAGYLVRSGVLENHRGHGLQHRLIRARELRARRNGWSRLVTDTTDNVPSANSLIRAGFKLFAPKTPWAFEHSLYWTKDL
jgi:GNAT superfamily N-acetyltransferase